MNETANATAKRRGSAARKFIKTLFSRKIVIVAAIGVLLFIYILLVIIYNHKKKKLRRSKRYHSPEE